MKIFFEDEAPAIGSGWRYVWAQAGSKWVDLSDHYGRTARVSAQTYQGLKPQAA